MSKATGDILQRNESKKCVICGHDNSYNVCFKCDGIVSARKVFKRYFMCNEGIYKKYHYVIYARRDLTEPEKEGELAKAMNSQYVTDKLKEKEKRFREDIVNVGLNGLTQDEKQIYFSSFAIEYKKMKDNYDYGCRKIGYDPGKGEFFIKDVDFMEQLRHDNIIRNRQYQ